MEKITRYFLRMRDSPSNRFTRGQVYEFTPAGYATDNQGRPCAIVIGNTLYWQEVTKPQEYNYETPTPPQQEQQAMKSTSKLSITTVTYINGTPVTDLTFDSFTRLIGQEQEHIARLDKLADTVKNSPVIDKLRAQHTANIEQLVSLMNAQELED